VTSKWVRLPEFLEGRTTHRNLVATLRSREVEFDWPGGLAYIEDPEIGRWATSIQLWINDSRKRVIVCAAMATKVFCLNLIDSQVHTIATLARLDGPGFLEVKPTPKGDLLLLCESAILCNTDSCNMKWSTNLENSGARITAVDDDLVWVEMVTREGAMGVVVTVSVATGEILWRSPIPTVGWE
jgi:hypothetical protein